MEHMPKLLMLSGGDSHIPSNPTRTHTSRFCISPGRDIHNPTSARVVSHVQMEGPWPPTAVPKVVSISLNFCVAWRSLAWRSLRCKEPIKDHGRMFTFSTALYLILGQRSHGWAGGVVANSCHGLRHSACRCTSPLIIYVTRLLFRHHPSSSQTTNVIANVVAKYLDFVDLYDVGFDDRKSAEETR